MSKRPVSTQKLYGHMRGHELGNTQEDGLNGYYLIQYLDGREDVRKSFSECETQLEAQSWFDGFIEAQQKTQPRQWVRIYETLDLIRTTEWYWKEKGFDSFEDWWVENGHPLFGQWAELEATYSYAKLAAPELFEVTYEEAKALAQQLAKFREVEPAMAKGGQVGNQCASKNESRDHAIRFTPTELAQQLGQQLAKFREVEPAMTRVEAGHSNGLLGGRGKKVTRDHALPLTTPIPVQEYVLDANSTEFREGFQKGINANKRAGEDVYRRFARIRRDAPEVAGQFLEGKFVRRYKNGKVEPDLKAAEVAAGIRKPDQPVRQTDPLGNCNRLASKLTREQLAEHIKHCQSLLDQEVAK